MHLFLKAPKLQKNLQTRQLQQKNEHVKSGDWNGRKVSPLLITEKARRSIHSGRHLVKEGADIVGRVLFDMAFDPMILIFGMLTLISYFSKEKSQPSHLDDKKFTYLPSDNPSLPPLCINCCQDHVEA